MQPEIDLKALFKLSYGLYIVSACDGEGRTDGLVANTVCQVTAEPPRISVCIHKGNLTHDFIAKSGAFSISVLDESAPLKFIGIFGFNSGRKIDKLAKVCSTIGKTGCPIVTEYALAVMEGKVIGAVTGKLPDAAIYAGPAGWPGTESRFLMRETLIVVGHPSLAAKGMLAPARIAGLPLLQQSTRPYIWRQWFESLGLAVASETPITVVNVMRGGPSTGIPVKSEQSDLNIALYGLHGDAPHLVVAPNSLADCAFATQWAVHLADTLQTAAIVLSDQSLGQSRATISPPADPGLRAVRLMPEGEAAERYRRYTNTATGRTAVRKHDCFRHEPRACRDRGRASPDRMKRTRWRPPAPCQDFP